MLFGYLVLQKKDWNEIMLNTVHLLEIRALSALVGTSRSFYCTNEKEKIGSKSFYRFVISGNCEKNKIVDNL